MSYIHPGYMGQATIGGFSCRFGDANITAKQDVQIPDLVMGHWDRAAYNFGKVEINGSISGPATESFANVVGGVSNSIFAWAYDRDDCGALSSKTVGLYYYCDAVNASNNYRTFSDVLANSCNFSCAAGDIAQFSVDVIGATAPVWSTNTSATANTTTEKLITWDIVNPVITAGSGITIATAALLSNFEFTINNNVTAVYAMNQTGTVIPGGGFFPAALVPGLRSITGSISCYDPQVFNGVAGYNTANDSGTGTWDANASRATIAFTVGNVAVSFRVQFHRIEPALGVGPIISTVGFTAVGVQTQLLT